MVLYINMIKTYMNSKEKLKHICNYTEQSVKNTNSIQISIMETLSNNDEEFIAEQKRKRRELAIDITLGNKKEEEWVEVVYDNEFKSTDVNTITPRIININLPKLNHKNYDDVYDDVIKFIDKNTSKTKHFNKNLDIKMGGGNYTDMTDFEKYEADLRRIITKINMSSSIVSMEGRIGPGKSILIGKDNWIYFKEIESRYNNVFKKFNLIYDDNIDPRKVIVFRNNNISSSGIMLVNNDGDFYMKETPIWYKQFCWFWIT